MQITDSIIGVFLIITLKKMNIHLTKSKSTVRAMPLNWDTKFNMKPFSCTQSTSKAIDHHQQILVVGKCS